MRVAHDGPAALRLMAERMPDVLVTDIGMPGMDGWELVRRTRGLVGGPRLVVVAVTGYGADADRHRSDDAGVDFHLLKPACPEEVLRILAHFRALGRPGSPPG